MSLPALTAYLSLQNPGHAIDSAYQLHLEYRLAEATVVSQLQAHGYKRVTTFTPTPPPSRPKPRTQWVKQETQLDRIERKLDQLLAL